MSKKATILYDIQHNTSEFNIKFHMKKVIAHAIISTFLIPDNMKLVSDLVHAKVEPLEVKEILIANVVTPLVEQYLSIGMGVDEDYYDDKGDTE